MLNVVYSKVRYNQLLEVKNLLQRCNLPFEDIDAHFDNYLVGIVDNVIAGTIGFEAYGKIALLRSMAVDIEYRNNGITNSLLRQIIKISKENQIQTLFLLTTSAEDYFLKHGFEMIDRNSLPEVIKTTQEFQNICPDTAVCMKKQI